MVVSLIRGKADAEELALRLRGGSVQRVPHPFEVTMIRMTRQVVEVVDAMRKIGGPTTADEIGAELGLTRRENGMIGGRLHSYKLKGLVIKVGMIPGTRGCVGQKTIWQLDEAVAATIAGVMLIRKSSGTVPSGWKHEALTEAMRDMSHSKECFDTLWERRA